jgi:hypothetical protein
MSTIGNNFTLPVAAPRVSIPEPRSAQALPGPAPRAEVQQPEVANVRVLEQRRVSEVRENASPRANSRILGTDRFVSFWARGHLVTRIRGEDGTVHYIPEQDPAASGRPGVRVNMEV